MRSLVVVFGSLNMDLVARVPRMPEPGETLAGHGFLANPGGKGANQAVACARQGATVEMVGRVGDDGFAESLRASLAAQGVGAEGVTRAQGQATGVAVILVDDHAQNAIAVIAGANALVDERDAEALRPRLQDAAMLLLQLEVPMPAVLRAAAVAREAGCPVLLNPAPAHALPDALWPLVDILVVNETEARLLAGVPSVTRDNAAAAAGLLMRRGPRQVIVTLGEHGVLCASAEGIQRYEAMRVRPVDTTAAGDTFIGALAAMLVEGRGMADAVRHAMKAAAICVTRPGAQASMPSRVEVEALSFGA
ncbi:MAG: ribokinase [Ramlibacter sp.]